ncbi:MAG: ABC transporter ATP-binding protein [Deltaproteobacteria bacterium]|nr:ABC transporter ATP-binding protein [Deltaproteobacteria bacterium]
MASKVTVHDQLDMKSIRLFRRRLWPYMWRHKLLMLVSTALVLLTTVCALVTPWLLGYAVDHVLVPHASRLLIPFGLMFFGADLLRAVSTVFQNYTITLFGQRVVHQLRQDLLRQYQYYPLAEFNRTPTGRLVTRLVNDTSSLQDLFTGGFAVALGELAAVSGIIGWLIILHPRMGLTCVSVFPVMAVAAHLFSRRIREASRLSRVALSTLNGTLAENISGMWLIQLFNKKDRFRSRFEEVSRPYTRAQLQTVESFAYFQPTITILASFSMSILIWYGGFLSLSHGVTLGLLVTFMSYLQSLYAPIRDITEKYSLFVAAMTSCERIFEFMDRPREPGTDAGVATPPALQTRGHIEFRNVWFRYSETAPWVLRDLSFTLAAGERVGIVGHTGAGKTTVSALLLRFFELERGAIYVDGVDIRTIDKRALRQALGYIQQEAFLFSGTIEENILLWQEWRRDAFARLPSHPSLLATSQVFEKGSNLSSGERQIVSFLRALAQNPGVLILDEATAHVDSLTERWIAQLSATAFRGRSVLIIAHRLATLKTVDRILVLHHGELVEAGTHQQLLAKRGLYHKLHEIQSRREELGAATTTTSSAAGASTTAPTEPA